MSDFQDIEDALASMTPGEWAIEARPSVDEYDAECGAEVRYTVAAPSDPFLMDNANYYPSALYPDDAAAIVTLRNRAPALLADHKAQATEINRLTSENERLREAGTALYMAGTWSCDRPVDEASLWVKMRDALGLAPGAATAALAASQTKGSE